MKGSDSSTSRSTKSYDDIVRLLVVGDAGVGKTSLLTRYIQDDECPIIYVPTVGVDVKVKCEIIEDKTVKIVVRDSAGQERFRPITEKYFPDADGVIIVYDSHNEESFSNVQNWMRQVKAYGNVNAEKIIVANKSDLSAVVPSSKAKEFASEYGLTCLETSAKNGDGVCDVFRSITESIINNPARRTVCTTSGEDDKWTHSCDSATQGSDRHGNRPRGQSRRKGRRSHFSPLFMKRVFECVRFRRR